jgi:hypothetical protein
MHECTSCGGSVETSFRFCPWCAAPQRRKLTEFFRPHPDIERDRGRALRVSRYLAPDCLRHVRFSVWSGDPDASRADAAVSLDEDEAARLMRFLTHEAEGAHDADSLGYGEDTQPSILG